MITGVIVAENSLDALNKLKERYSEYNDFSVKPSNKLNEFIFSVGLILHEQKLVSVIKSKKGY